MAKFQPRTLTITLYQDDWQQRVDQARTAAAVAEARWNDAKQRAQRGTRLMHQDPPDEAARKEFEGLALVADEVKAQAEADGCVLVTLQARTRKRWDAIVQQNPPRTGDDVSEEIRSTDAELGINDKAVGEILVPESIIKIVGVDDTVAELVESISSAQFDLLYGAAFALNRGTGSDPKAARSLMPSPSSSETAN